MRILMYICKNCGKEFTEKYSKWSDGNFCCKECARSYSTKNKRKEINEKVSKKLSLIHENKYIENPKICIICGKSFIPQKIKCRRSRRKTCSTHCEKLLGVKTKKIIGSNLGGGYRLNGHRKSIKGYYKGIHCDSTYELAYLIYCLDHNIDIKRCNETFEYIYNGEIHKYHPDFKVNNELIEIKGYYTDLIDIKAGSVNKPYKILYREDLQEVFEYVAKTYNKKYDKSGNNFYELYDK
jgi:hypothetical protein